jgi:hypothetical protein
MVYIRMYMYSCMKDIVHDIVHVHVQSHREHQFGTWNLELGTLNFELFSISPIHL